MSILLILLSSLFRGQKVNCLEISNKPLKIFRFGYPTLSLHHVSTQKTDMSGSTSVQMSSSRLGDIGWRIPSAGKGFMPFHKKDPTAEKWSNRLERNRSNIIFGRAWSPSLHWHVPTSSLFCWTPMLPLIIRLFTQSRRAYWAAERIRVRGWDRWEAFGLMRRVQKIVRRWGSLEEAECILDA